MILIDGHDIETLDAAALRALVLDLALERDTAVALLGGTSHGMLRIRAHVDPAVSVAEARAMKRQGPEAL